MNSKQVIIWVLLVLTACVIQAKSHFQEISKDIQERQASCEDCTPGLLAKLGTIQVDGVTASLTKFGPFIEKMTKLVEGVDNNLLGSIKELAGSIRLILVDVKDDFGSVTDELSTVLQKIFPCPRLQVHFTNLKNNLNCVLDDILNNDQSILDAQDFASLSQELAKLSANASLDIQKLVDEFLKNMLEVLGVCNIMYAIISPQATHIVKMFPALLNIMAKLMVTKREGFSSLADLKNHKSSLISMAFDVEVQILIDFLNSIIDALDGANINGSIGSYIDAIGITPFFKKIFTDVSEGGLGDSIKKLLRAILNLLNDIKAIIPQREAY